MRWVVDHWVNIASGWCGANSSVVSGFYWDYFSVSMHLRTIALILGGSDVVHCVHLSLTRTACSCLRAYGTERDYVVSYSLFYMLSWCFGGLSYSTV